MDPIPIPIKWFVLELVLLRYVKEEKKAVLLESTCFKMVNSSFYFDDDDFKAALHQNKIIFHFEMQKLIIAQIQVVLDILTEAVIYNTYMSTSGEKFNKVSYSCLNLFASRHYIDGIIFSRDDLLLMFIDLCILTKLGSDEYLMPCIMPAEEKPFSISEPETQEVPAMVVEFPNGGPMLGLYCALICYLINMENWALVVDKMKNPSLTISPASILKLLVIIQEKSLLSKFAICSHIQPVLSYDPIP